LTRIGIISAYDDDWDAQRVLRASRARGAVEVLRPTDFSVEIEGAPRVRVRGEDASAFDLYLTPRAIGEGGDADFQIELYQLLSRSVPVVNDVAALMTSIDKFKSSWLFAEAHLPSPRVVVVQGLEEACRALVELREAVVKPLYGSLGIGVERISVDHVPRLRELLATRGALYLQAYVADAYCDVRAFVIGDRVAGAITRRPRPGEFRANIHQGSDFQPCTLDPATVVLAVRAAKVIGLEYAGVDLLQTETGPLVIEVNGTPSWRAVEAATGRDMAEEIVEHALAVTRRRDEGARRRWREAQRRAT
jgi:RimK family alpha-L-glutamate ligase